MELAGRVALVTGGAAGIGLATARALAAAGANVVTVDRDAAADVVADVTDESALRSLFADLGRLDVLVNNAAIVTSAPFWELTEAQWGAVLDTNLSGVWRTSRAATAMLRRSPRGRIVNISSTGGVRAIPEFAHYVAAKHGVVGLTRAMAIELAGDRVTVNAILPGAVDSPMLAGLADELGLTPADVHERWLHEQLLPEVIPPEEVTGALLWLLSDAAQHVTGHCLAVDGGALAR
jgi:NAD(P)-dependent dehydrogenase (short-subunit alcohol dehydrogenase family)